MDPRPPAGRSRGRASRPRDQQGAQPAQQPQLQGEWARRPGQPQQPPAQAAYQSGSFQQQQPPAGPPLQGHWARRPGQPQPEQPARQQFSPAAPSLGRSLRAAVPQPGGHRGERTRSVERSHSQDRGSARSTSQSRVSEKPGGDGLGAGLPGRGAMRGKRNIGVEVVTRPPQWLNSKKGKSGRPLTLRANYFKLEAATDWCLYQYHVDFQPEEDRTFVRKGLLTVHKPTIGAYMFDGTSLYTSHRLPSDEMELLSMRKSDEQPIRILLKLTGTLESGDPHYLQFYNILMRKCLGHLKLQLVGRNYFDAHAKIEVREYQFELWPGYITSIRQHEKDLLMCTEVTHKVMRQEHLLSILNRIRAESSGNFQAACKAEVIGLTVLTDYNNHTYRIDDIDFTNNPMSTFSLKKEGREVSYKEYYENRYGIPIRNVSQPMLVTRSTNKGRGDGENETVYLVPELCRATGVTDSMKNDFRLMNAMASHTRINAQARVQKLNAFNLRLQNEPNVMTEFRDWQLTLEKQLIEIPARQLPETKIVMAGGCEVSAGPTADWTNHFRDRGLYSPEPLKDWVVIVPERLMGDTKRFVAGMQKSLKNFMISEPEYQPIRNDSAQNFNTEIENVMRRKQPSLIFCVVFKQRGDIYSAIKKKCCLDRPVPSQVLTSRCFDPKRMMSIATKVAIQINCKIGGSPWSVRIPPKGLMVVGFDVCHDTSQRGSDFGAMVASLDAGMSRYFSAVSKHSSSEELSNDLALNITKAMHKFRELNKAFPETIIVYRDGVGEGQVPYVFEHEVKHILGKLAQLYDRPPDKVPMTYVIVTKRLNTRLFLANRGTIANPPPGTVVDDVITDPMKYDFFLVAQSVKQGSVSPTAFSVIHDASDLDCDKMQMLTYRFMHMYFNWSGTVKVPAPVQFAHKLAFLVSQSIHAAPDVQLETLLYFL